MKKRFFVLTVLCALTCLSWGQSTIKERLEAKYGWAVELTSDGKKWYSIIKGTYKDKGVSGACDANGKELIPPEYDYVSVDYEDNYIKTIKDKKTSIYDLNGKLILATPYEDVNWYQMKNNPYCAVKLDGKWGLMDKKGELIVPCEYEDFSTHEVEKTGYCKVQQNKKCGVYDIKNKRLMIPCLYDDVSYHQFGEYDYAGVKLNGKNGCINRQGDLVVPCEFDEVCCWQLKDGDYCVVLQNEKSGVINRQGDLVVPCEFDEIYFFQLSQPKFQGMCGIKQGNRCGVYSIIKKKTIVPCKYDEIPILDLIDNGYAIVLLDNKFGAVDIDGNELIPCQYDFVSGSGNYFRAAKGGNRPEDAASLLLYSSEPKDAKWGVLDRNGNEVVPFDYDYVMGVVGDAAYVEKANKQSFKSFDSNVDYDTNKKIYYYELVVKGGKHGLYNVKTGETTGCVYDDVSMGSDYAVFSKNGKWGYVDVATCQVVIPFEYESATIFKNGVAQVKKNGKSSFLTDPKKGTSLTLANGGSSIKVDGNIPVIKEKQEESFAFIIANENYVHLKGADYAINDGKVFKEYCLKTFGMPESNVRYYEDATYGNIVNAVKKIKDIADVYEGDAKILIYFSGLGIADAASKERYLLPTDASLDALNVTGYSIQKLMDELNALNTKQTVVILDAPFSGLNKEGKMLGENRGVAIAPKPAATKGNTVLIAACSGSESAYSLKDYGHSLFTYGLLEKIQDSKGQCSLKEAIDYATSWVKKESLKRFNKTQSPQLQIPDNNTVKIQEIKF